MIPIITINPENNTIRRGWFGQEDYTYTYVHSAYTCVLRSVGQVHSLIGEGVDKESFLNSSAKQKPAVVGMCQTCKGELGDVNAVWAVAINRVEQLQHSAGVSVFVDKPLRWYNGTG
ncbi:unnamed protein product [Cuscuta campestris]|uniref:Uncharacterized protein n=1 Tax=Cuscuta campestris TaxID=132261 RepID=A0A484MEW3_9ASTE|nr:unnamed protein product [Cuscuta campestris]